MGLGGAGENAQASLVWNPELGWQLLRRSVTYKKAVAEFLAAATKAKDESALRAYRYLSTDASKCYERYGRLSSSTREGRDEERLHKRLLWLQQGEQSVDLFALPNPKPLRFKSGIKVNFSTFHYQKFNAWFGDIIRFPINPDTKSLGIKRLNGVWAFRPFSPSPMTYPLLTGNESLWSEGWVTRSQTQSKISYHVLAINSNFKLSEIKKAAETYIQNFLLHERGDGHRLEQRRKPRWDEVKYLLKVIELMNHEAGQRRFSYREIGKACNPPTAHSDRARLDWARQRVKYLRDDLMPMFERKEPKPPSRSRLHSDWTT